MTNKVRSKGNKKTQKTSGSHKNHDSKHRVRFNDKHHHDDGGDDTPKISKKRKREQEEAAALALQRKKSAIKEANKPIQETKLSSEKKAILSKLPVTIPAKHNNIQETNHQSIENDKITSLRIIAGSYERILYGLEISLSTTPSFKPLFIFPAHIGCIKCVAIGGKWLASGSTDEVIKLYDLSTLKEAGSLLQSEGSITSLSFHGNSHLLSTSENGNVSIYRTLDFSLLSTLRSHKGQVYSISIHPTGRIALTIGSDRCIRLWNLLTGRKANKVKFIDSKRPMDIGQFIQWSKDGKHFVVMSTSWCKVLNMECKVLFDIRPPGEGILIQRNRFNCLDYINYKDKDYLILGCEDKLIRIYDINFNQENPIAIIKGHTLRVKAVTFYNTTKGQNIIISASSDGTIRVWNFDKIINTTLKKSNTSKPFLGIEMNEQDCLITKYDTDKSRLTCLAVTSSIISEYIEKIEKIEMVGEKENKIGIVNEENSNKDESLSSDDK